MVDGGEQGRARSGRRRPGPTDECAEDRYASTAGAGATAPIGADGTASGKGASHRANTAKEYRRALSDAGVLEGSADELPTLEVLKAIVLRALPPRPAPQRVSKLEEWQPAVEARSSNDSGLKLFTIVCGSSIGTTRAASAD